MSASLTRLQQFYSDYEAEKLIHAILTREFEGQTAVFSSFGAYSALLLAMVAEVDPDTHILFLETGKHFPETIEYVETIIKKLGLTSVYFLTPDDAMLGRIDPEGNLWQSNVNRCCWLRKVEPLERELAKGFYKAVLTGRRHDQSDFRKDLEQIELFDDGIFRINPFANWSKEKMVEEFERRGLPNHPLVAKGYPSIGCAPCTMPVKDGENERSGRWGHTVNIDGSQKQECGIHLPSSETTDWIV
jgi:phosphoadenosine phosphosulfate reductase